MISASQIKDDVCDGVQKTWCNARFALAADELAPRMMDIADSEEFDFAPSL